MRHVRSEPHLTCADCGIAGVGCNKQCADLDSGVCPAATPEQIAAMDCGLQWAPVSVWLYITVCVCFNVLMLWVISENTAVANIHCSS